MQARRTGRVAWIRSLFFLVLAVCSCTHTYSPPKEPIRNYPQTNKIPLNVELRLSDELRTTKWEEERMGETWRIPLVLLCHS